VVISSTTLLVKNAIASLSNLIFARKQRLQSRYQHVNTSDILRRSKPKQPPEESTQDDPARR
jgi:hypothetical protein